MITTSITFDSDLDLTGAGYTGTVYTVGADNITIDGNGYSIIAPDASVGIDIFGHSGVTVTNLGIIGPSGIGINIRNSVNCSVAACVISAGHTAVWAQDSAGTVMSGERWIPAIDSAVKGF